MVVLVECCSLHFDCISKKPCKWVTHLSFQGWPHIRTPVQHCLCRQWGRKKRKNSPYQKQSVVWFHVLMAVSCLLHDEQSLMLRGVTNREVWLAYNGDYHSFFLKKTAANDGEIKLGETAGLFEQCCRQKSVNNQTNIFSESRDVEQWRMIPPNNK